MDKQQVGSTQKAVGNSVTIELGLLAPSLKSQLKPLKLDPSKVKQFDLDADAISRLVFNDLITESQSMQARKKLIAKIKKEVAVKAKEVNHG